MKKVFNRFAGDATLFLVAIITVLFFTQCRKHKDEPANGGLNGAFLVGKKWQTKVMTINPGMDFGDGQLVIDMLQKMPCLADNFTVFNADGTGVADEGADICPYATQRRNFNWKLKDDGTLEGFGDDDFKGTYKAVKNSDKKVTITVTGKFDEDDDMVRTLTIVYEAI